MNQMNLLRKIGKGFSIVAIDTGSCSEPKFSAFILLGIRQLHNLFVDASKRVEIPARCRLMQLRLLSFCPIAAVLIIFSK